MSSSEAKVSPTHCDLRSHVETDNLYVLLHFWRTEGGFQKRIEMLAQVLSKRGDFKRIEHLTAFIRFLLKTQDAYVLVYTSLMAPLVLLIRLLHPKVRVYYMVRGDEVTYVKNAGRHFRAFVAVAFQRALARMQCRFVFVCEDLRVVFERRLGRISRNYVLPNTIGRLLPTIAPFDGRVGLVGDFGTVKNIEFVIEHLSRGRFEVHLFGNKGVPETWDREWLHAHGVVDDLKGSLARHCSTVVFADSSAGFPNVLVEALEAGCSVLVHREFPFRLLPINELWRFDLSTVNGNTRGGASPLEDVLVRLMQEQRDFRRDNPELIQLIESDWEKRVWDVFGEEERCGSRSV